MDISRLIQVVPGYRILKQRDHAVYRNKNVTYSYYRLETYF